MKAIYASKLYKSSNRKQKIRAAIENPVNAELVAQLAKYLDKEYRSPEYLDGNKSEDASDAAPSMPDDMDPEMSDDFSPSDNLVQIPSGGGGDLGPIPDDLPTEDDLFNDEGEEPVDLGDDLGEEPSDIEPVEESTKIVSSTQIDSASFKAFLNARQDTCGVNRTQTKESELWVYYNDDINLNNIMTQVIECVNAAGYTYLEFNRLARSDNAIVFQIAESHEVQPIGTTDETK